MKRFLTATALALVSSATAAFAMLPTPAQTNLIHRYAPMTDVPTLSDSQLHDLIEIVESNDSARSKRIRSELVLQRRGSLLWN